MSGSHWDEVIERVVAGDVEALEELLERVPGAIAERGPNGETLLHEAARRGDLEIAKLLVRRGADLHVEAAWGQNPFEWAATLGAGEVARFLLESGAGPLNLWTAAALGLSEGVTRALADGDRGRVFAAGTEDAGWPPETAYRQGDAISDALYISCRNGHLSVATTLLESGGDPGARGYFGATAMHWAAIGGHADVVELLLEAGADPSIRDPRFDADVAGWAREGGHPTLARTLDSRTRR